MCVRATEADRGTGVVRVADAASAASAVATDPCAVGPLAVGPHDHELMLSVHTGPLWLRVLVTAGVFGMAAFALLRPFRGEPSGGVLVAVTATAAAVGLALLLLADRIDLPRQAVVPLLAMLALPLVAARRRARPSRPDADDGAAVPPGPSGLTWAAPLVLAAVTTGSAIEFGRAWLTGGAPAAVDAAHVHTGLLLAVAGLSWSALCGGGRGRLPRLVHGAAIGLAAVAVAGVVHAESLAAATTGA